ncbi:MAG: saccharopine dehydrogenase, partial [Solirubrobacteraceae bacterium]|nr:saccharopine dehydrogenase [Solirubrobacteraceae bacterium]
MAGRIVLFGATGYTGDLTARAMVARGLRPVLAARNAQRLDALAAELGGLETQVADVSAPESVRALVQRGDVLVSTVGPFVRWGEPALHAAVAGGAHYLDSTGETPFIREVFERHGPAAQAAGCGLLTAMGYDWVPGNLAGALALRDAGPAATRV